MQVTNGIKCKTAVFVVLLFLTVILFLTVFSGCSQQKVAHIIVLAGQSNCEGVSSCAELKKYVSEEKYSLYTNGFDNVKIVLNTNGVTENEFVNCKLGQGTSADYFGIEIGIADYLSEKYPDEDFYFVKRAHGGTTIYPFWNAPESESADCGMYFKALLEKTDSVIDTLTQQGKKVQVEALCWMQGESDAVNAENAETYYKYLSNMATYFRQKYREYSADGIKFVDGGISDYEPAEVYYNEEINNIKSSFSNTSDSNFYIDTAALNLTCHLEPKFNPDLIHYDSYSMFILGRNFGKYAYGK